MLYRTPSYAANTFDVFWYEKNLQGDIVAVYNSSGTKLASYNYTDAWGNHSISYSNGGASTGAQYNPFRYRGYYYDTDLYMYYLQSRYYDAKICRFINADIYVSTGQGIIGFNMYAYCRNKPVTRVDDEGTVDQDFVSEDDDLLDESWQDGKGAGGGGYYLNSSSNSQGNSNQNGTNSKTTNTSNHSLPKNGITVDSGTAIDMAIDYLGPGYYEASPGRYVSADGMRQVRMSNSDLLGTHAGGPHINFDRLSPKYTTRHVYICK